MQTTDFRKLQIWQLSLDLCQDIYRLTAMFPKTEMFGITSQMRRAAVSISSNIAEGAGRSSIRQFSYFISISIGSSCELETQLVISKRLEYISESDFKATEQHTR
ncbi:MAG: four helix bundle protein, partial [Bacteroidota bacterium]